MNRKVLFVVLSVLVLAVAVPAVGFALADELLVDVPPPPPLALFTAFDEPLNDQLTLPEGLKVTVTVPFFSVV